MLENLIRLNAEQAKEKEAGLVRWLRPEFQRTATVSPEPSEVESTGDQRPGIAKSKPPNGPGIAATRTETGKRKNKRAAH